MNDCRVSILPLRFTGPMWARRRPVTRLWFTGYLNWTLMLLATSASTSPPRTAAPQRCPWRAREGSSINIHAAAGRSRTRSFRCHVFIVWKKRHSLHLLWCGHKAKRTQEVVAMGAGEAGECTPVRHGWELCTVSAVRRFISVPSQQSLKKKQEAQAYKNESSHFFCFFCSYFYN